MLHTSLLTLWSVHVHITWFLLTGYVYIYLMNKESGQERQRCNPGSLLFVKREEKAGKVIKAITTENEKPNSKNATSAIPRPRNKNTKSRPQQHEKKSAPMMRKTEAPLTEEGKFTKKKKERKITLPKINVRFDWVLLPLDGNRSRIKLKNLKSNHLNSA